MSQLSGVREAVPDHVAIEHLAPYHPSDSSKTEGAAGTISWIRFCCSLFGRQKPSEQILIGLGVTLEGEKIILGFLQASTEMNECVRTFSEGCYKDMTRA